MRTIIALSALAALIGCGQGGILAPGGGSKEQSQSHEAGSIPPGASVEAGEKSVPEFQPAFPTQTRAPAVKTRTAFQVVKVAGGLNKPWAIAFLPDGRMLVTEKPGQLRIVTLQGQKSQPVEGLPRVDARGQGGLLDVELSPDFRRSGQIYWTYYEPRQGGNGLAVARGLASVRSCRAVFSRSFSTAISVRSSASTRTEAFRRTIHLSAARARGPRSGPPVIATYCRLLSTARDSYGRSRWVREAVTS